MQLGWRRRRTCGGAQEEAGEVDEFGQWAISSSSGGKRISPTQPNRAYSPSSICCSSSTGSSAAAVIYGSHQSSSVNCQHQHQRQRSAEESDWKATWFLREVSTSANLLPSPPVHVFTAFTRHPAATCLSCRLSFIPEAFSIGDGPLVAVQSHPSRAIETQLQRHFQLSGTCFKLPRSWFKLSWTSTYSPRSVSDVDDTHCRRHPKQHNGDSAVHLLSSAQSRAFDRSIHPSS